MNPTGNKSDFDDLTTNLKDLAYSYLEKYNPSKQQLKVFLLKKLLTSLCASKQSLIINISFIFKSFIFVFNLKAKILPNMKMNFS